MVLRSSIAIVIAAGLSIGLPPKAARADGFENVPTGSRTAAMGGAGIAGGSDSAMPTLNPAGLALVPSSIASLSASLYQLTGATIPSFVSDTSELPSRWGTLQVSQPGVRSVEFGSFPSGLAYFLHLGADDSPTVLAASLSVPRSIHRRFADSAEFLGNGVSVKDDLTSVFEETSYQAAVSWATAIGGLRIGASAIGAYTHALRTFELSELTVLGSAGFTRRQNDESSTLRSYDLGFLAGLQYDIAPWLRAGLTLRAPSIHLGGSAESTQNTTDLDSEAQPIVGTTQLHGDGVRGLPFRAGLGLEARGERWALALDVSLHLPRGGEYRVTGVQVDSQVGGPTGSFADHQAAVDARTDLSMVVNAAAGFEWALNESNHLRLGVFTDFSPEKTADQVLAARAAANVTKLPTLLELPINRYGATVGFGTKVGPVDTTFGLIGAYGAGRTLRAAPDSRFLGAAKAESTPASVFDLLAFLSAALNVEESAKKVIEAVEGEP